MILSFYWFLLYSIAISHFIASFCPVLHFKKASVFDVKKCFFFHSSSVLLVQHKIYFSLPFFASRFMCIHVHLSTHTHTNKFHFNFHFHMPHFMLGNGLLLNNLSSVLSVSLSIALLVFLFCATFFSPVFFSTYTGHTKEKEKWNKKLIDFSLSFASYAPLATVAKFAFLSCVLYNIICFWWIIKKEYWKEEKEEVLNGTGSRKKIISAFISIEEFF